jgi:hypothetical protein
VRGQAAARLPAEQGAQYLAAAKRFERARDAASAAVLAGRAVAAGEPKDLCLYTVLAALAADPQPDYALALACVVRARPRRRRED